MFSQVSLNLLSTYIFIKDFDRDRFGARLFLTIIGTLVSTITASKFDLTILLSDHSLVYEVF